MMERFVFSIMGCVHMEAAGASPEALLNSLAASGIRFWGAKVAGALTLRFYVRVKDAEAVERLAVRCGCDIRTLGRRGLPALRRRLRRRVALLVCAFTALVLIMVSSFFIWDIRITGSESVSEGRLRRALEECGVSIGSFWPAYSGDLIRNEMLLKIPELRFLAVNVDSSVAYVVVRERTEPPELYAADTPVSVVARHTGIITQMSTLQGMPLVKSGTAVTKGETLISGVIRSELTEDRYVHARGSVSARIFHELSASAPLSETVAEPVGANMSRWALLIGEKRLNLHFSGSKAPADCDKMTREYPFRLQGVFTLPITLVKETYSRYNTTTREADAASARQRLEAQLEAELMSRLSGRGEPLTMNFTAAGSDGVLIVTLRAECREDIALEVPISP